jgi:hypothetical protein
VSHRRAGRSAALTTQELPNQRIEPFRGFDVADVADFGQDGQPRALDGVAEVLGDRERGADVVVAVDEQRGTSTWGRASRRSSAEARAMARNPGGWKDRMLASNAATAAGEVPDENIVGRRVATNRSGGRSARARAWARRWAVTSAGREPAQPA